MANPTSEDPNRPVRGLVVEATKAGFAKLLSEANVHHANGLVLIGVVQLADKNIGGVFVRMRGLASPTPTRPERGAAVLTDDDDMGFPWPR